MTTTLRCDKDQMADDAIPLTNTLPDTASDYGDFGSDADEIEILDLLLAQVDSKVNEGQAPTLLVTDIEDYEPPKYLLLPKDNSHQSSTQVEIDPESQVLRERIQVKTGMPVILYIWRDADLLTC